jgi:hypothetical protein
VVYLCDVKTRKFDKILFLSCLLAGVENIHASPALREGERLSSVEVQYAGRHLFSDQVGFVYKASALSYLDLYGGVSVAVRQFAFVPYAGAEFFVSFAGFRPFIFMQVNQQLAPSLALYESLGLGCEVELGSRFYVGAEIATQLTKYGSLFLSYGAKFGVRL